ncbi:helix-turn-helix domain-containing protein [Streptomyces sp. NBC_01485]|uniref:helix-turn-helix domain-containing protein n=1 Tax=Streptomyces sp. NBC_01485 TaxID=2903884 RepID=UPI003FCCA06F
MALTVRCPAGLADMPPPGRRKADLVLSEDEQAQSTRWARWAKTAQFLALRAGIVLRCAEGGTNKRVAAELGVVERSVNRWRARFVAHRLDGLTDECLSLSRHLNNGSAERHGVCSGLVAMEPAAGRAEARTPAYVTDSYEGANRVM